MNSKTKLLQLGACLAAIVLTAPAAAQACKPGSCIRIGSYNIKYFANDGPANTPAEIGQLVWRITKQGDLDVVTLQEINKNGADWKGRGGLLAQLRNTGYELAVEGNFGGDDPGRPQFVVMLYRTKTLSLVGGKGSEIDVPTTYSAGKCTYKSLRPPVMAQFKTHSGNFAFRFVGVHLKSQRAVSGQETCDDDIRKFQAESILAFIAKQKGDAAGVNFIIAGDFNANFGAPEYDVFRKAGYQTLITGDCSAKKLEQCSYIVPKFAGIIDHILVHSSLHQAVKGSGTFGAVGNMKKYLSTQSDHVPVWASFQIGP